MTTKYTLTLLRKEKNQRTFTNNIYTQFQTVYEKDIDKKDNIIILQYIKIKIYNMGWTKTSYLNEIEQ